MKTNFKLTSLVVLVFSIFCSKSFAADSKYYAGKTVTDWNIVPRDANFFDDDDFKELFPKMPGDSWIKANGSDYGDSGGGATHITKFTTDADADDFEPHDAVMYKFAEDEVQKSISFAIADDDKDDDGTLDIAVLINGKWQHLTAVKTQGKDRYTNYDIDLPDETEAVMLYMLKDKEDVFLGATTVASIPAGTLPVSIFNVKAKRATKSISWQVGAAQNVDGYRIQGSTDANNWVDVKTVVASGEDSYTVVLSDMQKSASLYILRALCLLPLTQVKDKRKLIMGLSVMVMLGASFTSCSTEAATPTTTTSNLYKYYRVQSLQGNNVIETSKTITLE